MDVFIEIKKLLEKHKCDYTVSDHEPALTSADAARVRNTPIEQGAKAIILRSEGRFLMCVLPGNKKINLKKIKAVLDSKSVSLATPDEVLKTVHCRIGGVPPFGNLFKIHVYIERSLLLSDKISFNAGMLTRSITMKTEDYLDSVHGTIEEFAE